MIRILGIMTIEADKEVLLQCKIPEWLMRAVRMEKARRGIETVGPVISDALKAGLPANILKEAGNA